MGIESLQAFLRSAGALGVWVYIFLERILIPTGLHHFVYGPFIFGPAVVEGGLRSTGRASAGVQSEYGTAEDAVPGGRLCPAR
jgi:phosphotransferase system  glucose/maltose/N-acetylglucosamine-specific IIC component